MRSKGTRRKRSFWISEIPQIDELQSVTRPPAGDLPRSSEARSTLPSVDVNSAVLLSIPPYLVATTFGPANLLTKFQPSAV